MPGKLLQPGSTGPMERNSRRNTLKIRTATLFLAVACLGVSGFASSTAYSHNQGQQTSHRLPPTHRPGINDPIVYSQPTTLTARSRRRTTPPVETAILPRPTTTSRSIPATRTAPASPMYIGPVRTSILRRKATSRRSRSISMPITAASPGHCCRAMWSPATRTRPLSDSTTPAIRPSPTRSTPPTLT